MEKAVYIVLILCGILSQGICSVSEENNEKSSDLLIRQKRIVGGTVRRTQSSPYLVSVLEKGNDHCPATLLTTDVAISSAACFIHRNTRNMSIVTNSRAGVNHHEILRVIFYDPNYNPAHPTVKNLALVRFASPINFLASSNRPITIYNGNLATDHATSRVVSWGTPVVTGGRRYCSQHMETFSLLIISFEYCQNIYHNIVGNENICAVGSHAGEYCDTVADSGIPLIKSNQLLGIFVYRCNSCQIRPNVFMSLMNHEIRRWIHQHVPSLHLF